MRQIIVLLVLMVAFVQVQGQVNQTTGTTQKSTKSGAAISGRILDSESGEQLVQCTVALMSADSTKLLTGVVTNADGSFSLKGVDAGNYVLKASFVGYHTLYIKVPVKEARGNHDLGTIVMAQSSIVLDQTVVVGQLAEMEVKDDTVVYNADAFKMPEGSVADDLISKLPGVVIDDDGKIKVHGKELKKVVVNGKDFFGSDMKSTLENVPTDVINKIKVYDKQSDFTRITGIDDGNEETVMDLTLKKGQNKGWMGDVNGAYGTEERWQGRINARRFKENNSVFIFGNMGNTGGGSGRGGRNGGGGGINAIGDNTQGSMGANIVYGIKDFEIGGSVNYRGSNSKNKSNSFNQNFNKNTYNNRFQRTKSVSNNFDANFKMEWKIDSLTTIVFSPQITKGNSGSDNDGNSASFVGDPYVRGVTNPLDKAQRELIPDSIKQNETTSSSWSESESFNASGNLMFNRRLGGNPWFGPGAEKGSSGRNFSITLNGRTNSQTSYSTNYNNIYYNQGDSSRLTYRGTKTPNTNRSYTLGFSYNEPILRNLFAQINYRYEYNNRHSDGSTYDFGLIDEVGERLWNQYGVHTWELSEDSLSKYLSDQYSRYTDNENKTHNIDVTFRYIAGILNVSAGMRTQFQHQRMEYDYNNLDTIAQRDVKFMSPTLNANLRFSRQHSLRITYRGNSSQPNMTDMFANRDESNPLRIREGNPNLKPSFSSNISADYQRYFMESKRSINARLEYSTTSNSISSRTQYNGDGSTVTRPENINGNWNAGGTFSFGTPFIWQKLNLNTSTNANYRRGVSYLYQEGEKIKGVATEGTTSINEVITKNVRENLSLSLRLKDIDIRANGSLNWTKADNALISTSNRNTFDFRYSLSSTGNFSNGLGYSTDIGMSSRRGYTGANSNTDELVWNAEISYRFLKRRATISLQAFDILQQRTSFNRRVTDTGISDSDSRNIYAYYMVNFQYRIRQMGDRRRQGAPDFSAGERMGQEGRPQGGDGGSRFRVRSVGGGGARF